MIECFCFKCKRTTRATGVVFSKNSCRGRCSICDRGVFKVFKQPVKKIIRDKQSVGRGFVRRRLRYRPKAVEQFLKNKGDLVIMSIKVCRNPISSALKKILNALTFGDMGATIKQLNYDEVYHLFMLVTLQDGSMFRIEKNERVTISSPPTERPKDCMTVLVDPSKKLTLNQMFEESEDVYKNLYYYLAHRDNCQKFVFTMLSNVGLMDKRLEQFILQDAEQLIKSGNVQGFASALTSTAAFGDYILKGGGVI